MQNHADNFSFHQFRDRASAPLTGRLRTARMSLARVGFGRDHGHLPIEIERQDGLCYAPWPGPARSHPGRSAARAS